MSLVTVGETWNLYNCIRNRKSVVWSLVRACFTQAAALKSRDWSDRLQTPHSISRKGKEPEPHMSKTGYVSFIQWLPLTPLDTILWTNKNRHNSAGHSELRPGMRGLPCEKAWRLCYKLLCTPASSLCLTAIRRDSQLVLSLVPRKHQLFISELDTGKCHRQ